MSEDNRRKSIRTKLHASVILSHPKVGEVQLHTADISDGGAYILAEGYDLPAIGEVVQVQVQGIGAGEAPVVAMRIVRIDNKGIGLEFVDD